MKPFKAWIALSAKGYPAWFIGYHATKKALRSHYNQTYLHKLEEGGYSAIQVEISALKA